MQLIPARAPLTLVAIDILGQVLITKREIRFMIEITDWFSELVKTVPLTNLSAGIIAKDLWTIGC